MREMREGEGLQVTGQLNAALSESEALRTLEFRVLGTRLHAVSLAGAVAWVDAWAQTGSGGHIATVNPEFVMRARREPEFRQLLDRTRLNVPDGMGVVFAGRIGGVGVPERVTGVDLTLEIARLAAWRNWRILLVGGKPGVAELAARALVRKFPRMRKPTWVDVAPGPEGDPDAQRILGEGKPHIILVAFGAPHQEYWIDRNVTGRWPSVAIGVGGTFDYLSGLTQRAPKVVQRAGLEWAFRLWRDPSRWRRMRVLPQFAIEAIREAAQGDKV